MKELYDVPQIYNDLLEMYQAGKIDEDSFRDTLESLGADDEVQAIDLASAVKNKQMYIAGLDLRLDELKSKIKSIEYLKKINADEVDMMMKVIWEKLEKTGKDKIICKDISISFQGRKQPVKIKEGFTIDDVDSSFVQEKTEKVLLKNDAYSVLKTGKDVRGLELGENKKLVIK